MDLNRLTAHSLHSLEALRALSSYLFFLSADPGGIGYAFHRAWRAERKKQHPFGSGMKAGRNYEHTGR